MEPQTPLKALILEDLAPDVELLRHELATAGFDVRDRALADLEALAGALEEEQWDILLADYSLPGLTALDALRLIEERSLDLPVIIVSGVIGEQAAVELLRAGARDFVCKDNLARLGSAISRELEQARLRAERRLALAALEESERKLRALTEQMPAMLWTADRELRLTSATGAALDSLGVTSDELVGRTVAEIIDRLPFSPEFEQAHREALAGGRAVREVSLDGVMLEARLEPLGEAEGEPLGVIGVALDTSERRQLQAQLLHAQKMEAVGHLAGGIAHNFNNLLTAISGYCELALAKLAPGSDVRADVEEIRRATARAIGVTRGLLSFSRPDGGSREPLDLAVVVCELEALLRQLIGADVELETIVEPRLAPVRVARSQIEQAIVNLAVNAKDAMPHGGRLVLELQNLVLESPARRGSCLLAPGSYVSVTVSDDGIGMDERTLSRVFEPFFTTKGDLGTGLGLPTVYAIVEAAGGTIAVESSLGSGASFTVFLPAARA